jgi:transposase
MAKPRISVRRIKELLRLSSQCSLSRRQVAHSSKVSHSTVSDYLWRAERAGIGWPLPEHLTNQELEDKLFPRNKAGVPPSTKPLPDFASMDNQLRASGLTNLTLDYLWRQYKEQHPEGYQYSQFTTRFRKWQQGQGLQASPRAKRWIVHACEEDVEELKKWRRSNDRTKWAKAVVILDSYQGTANTTLSSKLGKSHRVVKRWIKAYIEKGIDGLRSPQPRHQSPEKLEKMKKRRDQVVEILHESPQLHRINRASWSLKTLSRAYEVKYGEPVGMSTLSEYISEEGYAFRKARRVLTSPDPEYREKLKEITRILSNLGEDEKFFSIDEFGPFSVKMQGGRAFTPHDLTRVVPQRQRSKGRLILTGALELSTNQITHFYSEKKNTDEMIRLLDVLLEQYSNQRCLYLSWDKASWHISNKLNDRVREVNSGAEAARHSIPIVKLAPLPASAQFLNVIESVFSGMAKAVIRNSDYQCVEECKIAIDAYIAERNEHYRRNPARAGNKIWGSELVQPRFNPSNNCKDPNWR